LVAAQMAMGIMWFELIDNAETKTLQSALMKFQTALSAWDGEGDATLIWTPRGELGNSCAKLIPRKPPAWAAGMWVSREGPAKSGRPWHRGTSSNAVLRDVYECG